MTRIFVFFLFVLAPVSFAANTQVPITVEGTGAVVTEAPRYYLGPVVNSGNFELSGWFNKVEYTFTAVDTVPGFSIATWEVTEPSSFWGLFPETITKYPNRKSILLSFDKDGFKVKAIFSPRAIPVTKLACDSTQTVPRMADCSHSQRKTTPSCTAAELPWAILTQGQIEATTADFLFDKWSWVTSPLQLEGSATLKVLCAAKKYPVTVAVSGSGSVLINGVTCSSNVSCASVVKGQSVTLTAKPANGSTFRGWRTIDASGRSKYYPETASLSLTQVSGGLKVEATFLPNPRTRQLAFVRSIPGPEMYDVAKASGYALDKAGNLYVAAPDKIVKFSPTGQHLGQFLQPQDTFDKYSSIAVNSKGTIYVASPIKKKVLVFDPAGRLLGQLDGDGVGPEDKPFELLGKYYEPKGYCSDYWGTFFIVKVDEADNVYVTDRYNIRKFSPEGQLLSTWGGLGSGPGQFNAIQGLAVGTEFIYVSDTGNSRIQVLDRNGNAVDQISIEAAPANPFPVNGTKDRWCYLHTPWDAADSVVPTSLALDGKGNLYVVTETNQRCRINLTTGEQHKDYNGTIGEVAPFQQYKPSWGQLLFDNTGMLYQRNSHGVARLDPVTHKIVRQFKGSSAFFTDESRAGLDAPVHLRGTQDGSIWFSSKGVVMKIDNTGKIVRSVPLPAAQEISGLALDSKGNAYVSLDTMIPQQKIQVYKFNAAVVQQSVWDFAAWGSRGVYVDAKDNVYLMLPKEFAKLNTSGTVVAKFPVPSEPQDYEVVQGLSKDDLVQTISYHPPKVLRFYNMDATIAWTIDNPSAYTKFTDDGYFYGMGVGDYTQALGVTQFSQFYQNGSKHDTIRVTYTGESPGGLHSVDKWGMYYFYNGQRISVYKLVP